MLIFKEEKDNILWGIWKIEEDTETLLSWLSEKGYTNKISSEKRLRELTAVRVLLKELTGTEQKIYYNENGKPYLTDHSYQISISHTKGYAAVILTQSGKTGIDIEYVSDKVMRVKSKFITESEYINEKNERNHLLLHWCAKETMYKAMDYVGIDFKKNLFVEGFNPDKEGIFEGYVKYLNEVIKFDIHYLVDPEYVITYTY